MRNIPEKFYLYLSLNAYGTKKFLALLEGRLPLTDPVRFNDPFDCRQGFDHSGIKEKAHPTEDPEMMLAFATAKAENNWKHRYNLFCVSETFENILMWSHYSESHSGICLELSYDDSKRPTDCFFQPVRYSTHFSTIDSARNDDPEAVKTFYLTKSADWMYEKEWRFVAPKNDADAKDGFDGLISPSPFKVNRILLGVKFNPLLYEDYFCDQNSQLSFLSENDRNEIREALQTTTHNGWVLGDRKRALEILKKIKVDEETDTVAIAEKKKSVFRSVVAQFFGDNGNTVSMRKRENDFGVEPQ